MRLPATSSRLDHLRRERVPDVVPTMQREVVVSSGNWFGDFVREDLRQTWERQVDEIVMNGDPMRVRLHTAADDLQQERLSQQWRSAGSYVRTSEPASGFSWASWSDLGFTTDAGSFRYDTSPLEDLARKLDQDLGATETSFGFTPPPAAAPSSKVIDAEWREATEEEEDLQRFVTFECTVHAPWIGCEASRPDCVRRMHRVGQDVSVHANFVVRDKRRSA